MTDMIISVAPHVTCFKLHRLYHNRTSHSCQVETLAVYSGVRRPIAHTNRLIW